ncbi:hypothetical protein BDZ90DRAFT_246216 [Jaminaea rosea]|uniref:DNA primase large subunit C-terminal domain-containing protein n=1 Tax=Jaminaea rosea TaxID=1569628 RepID=A0A316UST2_9BASI|nr:hypothetical protein BDZ90DRAFT_246216 [Jaminaea rosea]PWN27848.1 hypothetical protein BDZ90DRAFT_246216 [Jaminaea rosea]
MFRTANPTSALPSPSAMQRHAGAPSSSASPAIDRHATGSSRMAGPKRYPHRLNFYNRPPTMEVTIDQFESWAIDRLKADTPLHNQDTHLPLSASTASRNGIDIEMERMKDHISHFVLRLAFCKTEDLQRRFVRAENVLFRLRFETDDSTAREAFLRTLDLNWEPVSQQEKQQFKEELLAATPSLGQRDWDGEAFFKVPWTKVPDLVEKRRVFLRRGVAWVPMREQSSLIMAEFTNRLNKELEYTARSLPRLDEDDRLLPLLNHLSLGFLAGLSSDFTNSSAAMVGEDGQALEIRAEMINALVKKHAPMCMRQLGQTLEERKHLKHQGRLQFGLFLKELGLGVEQALLFWRRSFANITDDKFNKEYKYNVRYNYGLEGKRVDYPARSCARIIMQDTPGPQDTHGCPFRHYSPANLASTLSTTYGLGQAQSSEILATVKSGHYHVACTRLFEMTHGVARGKGLDGKGESVAHPNRYFERSWKLQQSGAVDEAGDDEGDSKAGIKMETGNDEEPKWTKAALKADTTSSKQAAPIDVDEFGDDDFDFDALDQVEAAEYEKRAAATGNSGTSSPAAAIETPGSAGKGDDGEGEGEGAGEAAAPSEEMEVDED